MIDRQLRILMIGAHPDDCEFKTAGIAVKYSSLGHIVKFVSATNGDAGHYSLGGSALARVRLEEAGKSAETADIQYQILDIHDGNLEASINTRERFISLIREFKPDMIFTHRPNDYHPDHRQTGILVQDSSYMLIVPNICPLVPPLNHMPVILYMQDHFKRPTEFKPDIVVDIDDVIDSKIKMVNCHRSQVYEWLPWTEGELDKVPKGEKDKFIWLKDKQFKRDGSIADKFRSELIKRYGKERGSNVKFAEAFEISEYGMGLSDDQISIYFPF